MVSLETLQDSFVEFLPYIRRHARLAFGNLDFEKRTEAVSSVVTLAWKHWHRLGERGKADNPGILKAVTYYSIKQTKAGRRIDSAGKPRDVLALRPYGKVTFEPGCLEDFVGKETPIPEQVSFRVDVPAFFRTLKTRQRKMALDLAEGMTTSDAAEKYNLSAGRISQFRREFKLAFDRYFQE